MKIEMDEDVKWTILIVSIAAVLFAALLFNYLIQKSAFENGFSEKQAEGGTVTMWVKQP